MSFTFKISADKANNILISQISGFATSVEEYEKWENAFEQTWQKDFHDQPVKILADQRGFKATLPAIQERIMQYRMKKASKVIASATVVDDPIAQLQLKRLSAESGLKARENFFVDMDEALQWLKNQ